MNKLLIYNDFDREFWNRELEAFVPRKIYDMHTHLWTESGQEHLPPAVGGGLRTENGLQALKNWSAQLFPDRECHFLALGTPIPGMNVAAHNQWLAQELAADAASVAGMLVTPATVQDELREGFVKHKFLAVKPYLFFAPDPKSARITDFLPEPLLEVINDYGRAVVLHLSMPDGADSAQNIADLKYLTAKYPDVKWILAHCARAFNGVFLEKSIHIFKHIPNIYYDTSAVNDLYTHYLLLKHENIDRIMFGSDNIASGCSRGKYISYARAWQFYPGAENSAHCDGRATLVVYEQLLQQKRALDMLEFPIAAADRIFCRNAELFISELTGKSVSPEPGRTGRGDK
ncbi:MAG: amidohydrolase family protein [Victivallales bacterium]|nr:amidohydrolase family protein [Victivallales bacterium]